MLVVAIAFVLVAYIALILGATLIAILSDIIEHWNE